MSYSQDVLNARNLGLQYPLSMGTALIFESDYQMVKEWDEHLLVSIPTLIRNLESAMPKETDWSRVEINDIVDTLLREMDELIGIVSILRPKCTVTFTCPDYSTIQQKYPLGKFRETLTPNQQRLQDLQEAVRFILLTNKDSISHVISFPELKLERDSRHTTLMTAYPIDLLSQYQFPSLSLLESNTGRLKRKKEWYTKLTYHPKEENHFRIPFCLFTLLVFGDGKHFLANRVSLRRTVYMLADKHRWNSLSTEGRIRQSLNSLPPDQKEIKETLLSFL